MVAVIAGRAERAKRVNEGAADEKVAARGTYDERRKENVHVAN
jgi:hypothetical protein